MANLVGTQVAANYLKAEAPFSRFGTRDLAFFSVEIANVHVDHALPNSLFAKAVRGIQLNAELYFVGTPAANAFVIAVAADTLGNEVEGGSARTFSLKEAVDAATGATSTVAALAASGASIA